MSEAPNVHLDFQVHWCPEHLEPFRERWPEGAGVAMIRLFEAAVADERILAAAPRNAEGKAMGASLDALLLEHSPLCCFLGAEVMQAIYKESGVLP